MRVDWEETEQNPSSGADTPEKVHPVEVWVLSFIVFTLVVMYLCCFKDFDYFWGFCMSCGDINFMNFLFNTALICIKYIGSVVSAQVS